MNIVLGLVGPITQVLQYAGSRIIDQLSYLVHYKTNVDDLREQMASLELLETDVQRSVNAACIKGEVIKVVVEGWLTRVDLLQSKETELQNALKESKGCFACSLHYHVGKDAKQMIDEVKELLNEGRTIDVVSEPSPLPPGLETMGTLDFQVYDSTKVAMDQIVEALKHEDVNMVGVYGLGGVGKTTLMKELAKILKRENLFYQVVMITVSQDPVWTKIQGEIAENLGLKLTEEYLSLRARRLLDRLKKEQCILIVLDDVWKPLNLLEQVGIPCGKNCKVVLTTRQLGVCHQMRAQINVEVKVLSEGDAWRLFKWAAGDCIEDNDTLHPVAKQIVGDCGGLPLAIVTIGRALWAKDQYVWRDAAIQLKKSSSVPPDIEGIHEKVFSSIKLSYDFLGNDVTKFCLLLCCMFPEDFSISEDDLLPYVVGEGVFVDVDTLEEVRNRLHTQMERLKGSCLLFDDSTRKEHRVKMHDVIRDVSIWIASTKGNDFVLKYDRGLTDFSDFNSLRKCKRLSLTRNEITKLPNRLIDYCSQLITVSLIGNKDLKEIPDGFFQGMISLKTLDLRRTYIPSIPSSLLCCTDLRALRISRIESGLPALNVSLLGKLKKLEILDIQESNVEELPEKIGELVNLKSLNLSENKSLTIAPNTLSRLSLLEDLDARGCLNIDGVTKEEEEEVIGQSRLVEVASLSALTRLYTWRLNAEYLCANITCRWEKLTHFHVYFGRDVEFDFDLPDELPAVTRALTITESSCHAIANWVRVHLLERAEQLQLTGCRGFKSVLTGFNNLRVLVVDRCNDMNYLLSAVGDNQVPRIAFTSLECLYLFRLRNFRAICSHGSLPSGGCFNNLRFLYLESCSGLTCIIPSDLLAKLSNLEDFSVEHCHEATEVFNSKGLEEGQATMAKLKRLALEGLPRLRTIWEGVVSPLSLQNLEQIHLIGLGRWELDFIFTLDMARRLQKLKELHIGRCSRLVQIVSVVEASNDQNTQQLGSSSSTNNQRPSSSSSSSLLLPATPIFGNLRSLHIWFCSSLKHILPMSLAQGLPQLEELEIEYCSNLEEIIVNDDTGKKEAMSKLVFPRLRYLNLNDLKNLSMVSKGVLHHDWPSLETLSIEDCPKLRRLPLSLKTTTKLKKIEVKKEWFDGLEWDDDDKLHLQERVEVRFLIEYLHEFRRRFLE